MKPAIGETIGRLTVLGVGDSGKLLCRCECGVTKYVSASHLGVGMTESCGCFGVERRAAAARKHGMYKHPLYVTWSQMRGRCLCPTNVAFHNYGGRGITVDARWNDFAKFVSDMGAKPSKHHTLERRDNEKGYGPDNCEWALRNAQHKNKRTNVRITLPDGRKFQTLREACAALGVDYGTAQYRRRRGASMEATLAVVGPKRGKPVTISGESFPSIAEAARVLGVPLRRAMARIERGWTINDALQVAVKQQRRDSSTGRLLPNSSEQQQ